MSYQENPLRAPDLGYGAPRRVNPLERLGQELEARRLKHDLIDIRFACQDTLEEAVNGNKWSFPLDLKITTITNKRYTQFRRLEGEQIQINRESIQYHPQFNFEQAQLEYREVPKDAKSGEAYTSHISFSIPSSAIPEGSIAILATPSHTAMYKQLHKQEFIEEQRQRSANFSFQNEWLSNVNTEILTDNVDWKHNENRRLDIVIVQRRGNTFYKLQNPREEQKSSEKNSPHKVFTYHYTKPGHTLDFSKNLNPQKVQIIHPQADLLSLTIPLQEVAKSKEEIEARNRLYNQDSRVYILVEGSSQDEGKKATTSIFSFNSSPTSVANS